MLPQVQPYILPRNSKEGCMDFSKPLSSSSKNQNKRRGLSRAKAQVRLHREDSRALVRHLFQDKCESQSISALWSYVLPQEHVENGSRLTGNKRECIPLYTHVNTVMKKSILETVSENVTFYSNFFCKRHNWRAIETLTPGFTLSIFEYITQDDAYHA